MSPLRVMFRSDQKNFPDPDPNNNLDLDPTLSFFCLEIENCHQKIKFLNKDTKNLKKTCFCSKFFCLFRIRPGLNPFRLSYLIPSRTKHAPGDALPVVTFFSCKKTAQLLNNNNT